MSKLLNLIKYTLRLGNLLPRQPVMGYLEWTLLRDLLQQNDINCVLDVGANRANMSEICAGLDMGGSFVHLNRLRRILSLLWQPFGTIQNGWVITMP